MLRILSLAAISTFTLNACTSTQSEAFVSCGLGGALVGALLGDTKAAIGAGLGAGAVCAIIATELDAKREAALLQEQSLDQQIASQAYENAQLQADNSQLSQEISLLEAQAANINALRAQNEEEAARVIGEIRGEKMAAPQRIEIINDRISSIDTLLADETLAPSKKQTLRQLQNLLEERIQIIGRLENITV